MIVRLAHTNETGQRRTPFQAAQQCFAGAEIEIGIAPIDGGDRIEAMRFDGLDDIGLERRRPFGRAERAVVHVPAGASRDLSDFGSGQPARLVPVELGDAREGDMVEIHIEAHADRIGRHHEIDLARLEHLHLRIARARRQGAHHDRGAATLAAHQLGDLVDIGDRERDHRRTRR